MGSSSSNRTQRGLAVAGLTLALGWGAYLALRTDAAPDAPVDESSPAPVAAAFQPPPPPGAPAPGAPSLPAAGNEASAVDEPAPFHEGDEGDHGAEHHGQQPFLAQGEMPPPDHTAPPAPMPEPREEVPQSTKIAARTAGLQTLEAFTERLQGEIEAAQEAGDAEAERRARTRLERMTALRTRRAAELAELEASGGQTP